MNKMGKTGSVKRVPASRKYRPAPNKPLCKYMHRHCLRPRLDGYDYCISHILIDEDAPFRQCTFIHLPNQRRCSNAAPKNEKRESLCPYHLKQVQLAKVCQPLQQQPYRMNDAQKLAQLFILSIFERYCQDEQHDPSYDADHEVCVLKKLFKEEPLVNDTNDISNIGSSEEGRKTQVSESWLGQSDESESELDDSDTDDPLKYADVYTYEEVIRIYYEKLLQLRSKYMEELKVQQYFLRERYRDYLARRKNEKLSPGSEECKSLKEKKKREELTARLNYRKHFGAEAVLRHRLRQKKQNLNDNRSKPTSSKQESCVHMENGSRCTNAAVVLSEYCMNHIVTDPKQFLFKYCPGNNGECRKVVPQFEEDPRCIVHVQSSLPVFSSNEKVSTATSSFSKAPAGEYPNANTVFPCEKEEVDHFQAMDDIASLGLDDIVPGSLFGLNQFGEPGESTDSATSNDGSNFFQL